MENDNDHTYWIKNIYFEDYVIRKYQISKWKINFVSEWTNYADFNEEIFGNMVRKDEVNNECRQTVGS